MLGDGSKVTVHFGVYDPNAPLAVAAATVAIRAAVFPNPAHGTAALRLPAGISAQPITVLDVEGRLVRRYPTPLRADALLDLSGLPAGIYLVRCGQFIERLLVE
nr:T9SS type A sorting domain-containing protein [Hymenobacter negativus]